MDWRVEVSRGFAKTVRSAQNRSLAVAARYESTERQQLTTLSEYPRGFARRLEPVTEVVFRRKARRPGGLRHLCGDFRRLAGVLELLSGLAEGAAARHQANDIGA